MVHEVPPMVKDFLRESTFETGYFCIILTYGCRHGGAAELAKALCGECGVRVDYVNTLHMADNWLPAFDMDAERAMDKHIPEAACGHHRRRQGAQTRNLARHGQ